MADSDDAAGGATLTVTPGDRDAIIRTVLGEAGNQGDLGQAAVAHVIMNRAIGSGSSPTAVVLAPNQFEANAGGLQSYAPSSSAYQGAAKIVDGVLGGDVPDPTNGATNFLNPDTVMARSGRLPKWARGDAIQIGQHVFLGGRSQQPQQQPAAANAPDAPSAIAAAVQPQQPAQAGQGSVAPGLLAFVPDGLSHAVDQDPATAPIITSAAPPAGRGKPAPAAPQMSDAQLEGMLTGKAPATAPPAAQMSDDQLETLLTGKAPAAAPAAAPASSTGPGVSFAPAGVDPTKMSDGDLKHMLTSGGAAKPGYPAPAAPGAPAPALTPAQVASGIDPATGERVVGGKPFTSDAGHWNALVSAANGGLQGFGADVMAAAAALKAKLADNDPKSLGNLYSQAKSTYEGGRQAYASASPLTSALTEGGGSLATAVPALAAGGAGLAATGNALVDGMRAAPIFARAAPAAEAAGSFFSGTAGRAVAAANGAPAVAMNPLLRGASLATRGAATGAAGAAISSNLSDQPLSEQVKQGAEAGGVVSVGAPALFGAARAGVNRLLGAGSVSPETAQLAQVAQSYGIPIRPGQLTESPGVRFADSTLSRTPGMGYGGEAAKQATAFNSAVAGTMGETADKITPSVMTAAKQRIGAALDSVAANTTIQQDQPFIGDLTHIAQEAQGVLADSEMKPLQTQMQNVLGKFDGSGAMAGDAYQALTRTGAPLDRLMNSSDSNLRYYAGLVRDALDDAMERSASPDVLDQLRQARSQYKAMKTIEPLVEKSTTGDVSPAGLMQAVRSSYGGMAYGGGGPLGDLARVGQRFLKEPPSSGTAERLQAGENVGKVKDTIGTLGALGAAALGADKAAPYLAPYVSPEMILPTLASMGGGFAAGRAASSVLRSPAVANMLVQRALGAQPAANPLLAGISAGAPMVAGPTVNRLLLPPPGRAATP